MTFAILENQLKHCNVKRNRGIFEGQMLLQYKSSVTPV